MTQQWDRSNDPIPQHGIRLSDAFTLFYQKVTPRWRQLEDAISAAHQARGGKFTARGDKPFFDAARAQDDARDRAAELFEGALMTGQPQGLIWDPVIGSLQLSRHAWRGCASSHVFSLAQDATHCNGRRCVVFFIRDDFEEWLSEQAVPAGMAAPKATGGRPSSMDGIKAELNTWVKGGKHRTVEELDRWAPSRKKQDYSQARIARALAAWCADNGGDTSSNTIQKVLKTELGEALKKI